MISYAFMNASNKVSYTGLFPNTEEDFHRVEKNRKSNYELVHEILRKYLLKF